VKQHNKCAACASPLDDRNQGIELWGSWFCSGCFITNASKTHRELTPDDIALLRTIGRELAGFLPPDLLEMILVGFHKRAAETAKRPSEEELQRCVGEIQRLAAFAAFRHVLNLLKTWQMTFNEFVENQESDIREKIRRLTELE